MLDERVGDINKVDYLDEKDYIMRMIKEMVRVLFSLMLGKKYVSVELPDENKYNVSGKGLDDFLRMVDYGQINEAENMLLENLDYDSREENLAAIRLYQYIGEKDEDFLSKCNYSKEEALEGLKMLAEKAGFGEVNKIFTEL